jgi:hypothetical protein
MMRRLIRSTFAISLLCASALAAQSAQSAQPDGAQARVRYTINDGWRFSLEGVEFAEKPLVSDAGWEEVTLPHTWNAHDPFIPPLSVGFALYGGIYRDVWLVATDPVHLKVTDDASSGVYVSTPRVSRERGDARVRGTVVNASGATRRLRVSSTVLDADGVRVAEVTTNVPVAAGREAAFAQALPPVRDPRLWSPDEPYLYTLRTEIHDGGRLLDRVENPLGFRWFRFDPAQGFFLNGEPLKLRGTNRHQDMAGFGSALSNEQHLRDVEIIKAMGANFLRLATALSRGARDLALTYRGDRRLVLLETDVR